VTSIQPVVAILMVVGALISLVVTPRRIQQRYYRFGRTGDRGYFLWFTAACEALNGAGGLAGLALLAQYMGNVQLTITLFGVGIAAIVLGIVGILTVMLVAIRRSGESPA
jgi:hypothetical protein